MTRDYEMASWQSPPLAYAAAMVADDDDEDDERDYSDCAHG
jgi:hypothetical protein